MNETTATPDALHLDDPATCPQSTPPVIESTLTQGEVTSTQPPPEPESEDMPTVPLPPLKREFHLNSWFLLALALVVILVGEHAQAVLAYVQTAYFPHEAHVTLFTRGKSVHERYTFLAVTGTVDNSSHQIPSRLLFSQSPTQTITVPATGQAQTQPTQAYGSITFYNEAPYSQTIQAGTVLATKNSVQVVTDAEVVISAGNPPYSYGVAQAPAHSLQAGSIGNLPPLAMNSTCCLAGIAVKNTTSFRGGEDPQTYTIVSQADLAQAQSKAASLLDPLAKDAVRKQERDSEQSLTTLQCSFTTRALPALGEKAAQATVTVFESCLMQVYDTASLESLTRSAFMQDVQTYRGAGYTPKQELNIALAKQTLVERSHHTYTLLVTVEGMLLYQPTATQLHRLTSLIAGKSLSQARSILLANEGIEGVYIQPANASDTGLPSDPAQIQIHLV